MPCTSSGTWAPPSPSSSPVRPASFSLRRLRRAAAPSSGGSRAGGGGGGRAGAAALREEARGLAFRRAPHRLTPPRCFARRLRCCVRHCQVWRWRLLDGCPQAGARHALHHPRGHGWCHWYLRPHCCCHRDRYWCVSTPPFGCPGVSAAELTLPLLQWTATTAPRRASRTSAVVWLSALAAWPLELLLASSVTPVSAPLPSSRSSSSA